MMYIGRPLAQTMDDCHTLIQQMTDGVQKNEADMSGLFLKTGSHLAGKIGFLGIQKENYRADVGYLLHPNLQGKGIMKEAMKAVLDFGFVTMNLHSVEANVNPSNTASIGLLERFGFVREAYFRENYFYEGKFLDSAVYSLLAPH